MSVFEEAKAKLEEFLGGSVLGDAKAVVAKLEADVAAGKADVADVEKKLESKKADVLAAVEAAVKAAQDGLKADTPLAVADVKAVLQSVLDAVVKANV